MLSCKVGNTLINSIDYQEKDLRSWSKRKLLKCPVCNNSVVYRNGLIKMPHFAHEKDSDCTYSFYENESKEHASGKVLLYKALKKIDSINNLKLEAYIPETKQRPDLYFEINKQRFVIEYQCSPPLLSEFKERRELYKLAGIKDIWIFGTEKYNYNPTGKLKMKAVENDWFIIEQRLYYMNPFEEVLYKFYRYFDFETRYPVVSVNINNCKFKIINNEIILSDLEYKKRETGMKSNTNKYDALGKHQYIVSNTINHAGDNSIITFHVNEPLTLNKFYEKLLQLKNPSKDIIVFLPLACDSRIIEFENLFNSLNNKLNITRSKIKHFYEPNLAEQYPVCSLKRRY